MPPLFSSDLPAKKNNREPVDTTKLPLLFLEQKQKITFYITLDRSYDDNKKIIIVVGNTIGTAYTQNIAILLQFKSWKDVLQTIDDIQGERNLKKRMQKEFKGLNQAKEQTFNTFQTRFVPYMPYITQDDDNL